MTMTGYYFSFVSRAAVAAFFLSVGNSQKIPVTVSYQPATWWSLPIYMAEQNGYFAELGLEVTQINVS
jgi:ABC-type nitrate/sulfonate/bicarbonate transport system substrate-binding protein